MNDLDDDDDTDDDTDDDDVDEGMEVVITDSAVNDCEKNSKIQFNFVMILVLTNSYS